MNSENDWNVYRTRFLVRARKLTTPLVFTDALGREQRGQPGDYLVEIFDGFLSITPGKFFEDIYVPLAPPLDSAPVIAESSRVESQGVHRVPVLAPEPLPSIAKVVASPLPRAGGFGPARASLEISVPAALPA